MVIPFICSSSIIFLDKPVNIFLAISSEQRAHRYIHRLHANMILDFLSPYSPTFAQMNVKVNCISDCSKWFSNPLLWFICIHAARGTPLVYMHTCCKRYSFGLYAYMLQEVLLWFICIHVARGTPLVYMHTCCKRYSFGLYAYMLQEVLLWFICIHAARGTPLVYMHTCCKRYSFGLYAYMLQEVLLWFKCIHAARGTSSQCIWIHWMTIHY